MLFFFICIFSHSHAVICFSIYFRIFTLTLIPSSLGSDNKNVRVEWLVRTQQKASRLISVPAKASGRGGWGGRTDHQLPRQYEWVTWLIWYGMTRRYKYEFKGWRSYKGKKNGKCLISVPDWYFGRLSSDFDEIKSILFSSTVCT